MANVTVHLPDELVRLLQDGGDVERRLLEAAVIELFRGGSISSGRAAEVLGVDRQTFLDVLYKKQVPFLVLPSEPRA